MVINMAGMAHRAQPDSWAGTWSPAAGAEQGQAGAAGSGKGQWGDEGLWADGGDLSQLGSRGKGELRAGLGGGRGGGTEHPLPPSRRALPAQGRGHPGEHPEEEGLEVLYGIPHPPDERDASA